MNQNLDASRNRYGRARLRAVCPPTHSVIDCVASEDREGAVRRDGIDRLQHAVGQSRGRVALHKLHPSIMQIRTMPQHGSLTARAPYCRTEGVLEGDFR